jgi:hypothetical protein
MLKNRTIKDISLDIAKNRPSNQMMQDMVKEEKKVAQLKKKVQEKNAMHQAFRRTVSPPPPQPSSSTTPYGKAKKKAEELYIERHADQSELGFFSLSQKDIDVSIAIPSLFLGSDSSNSSPKVSRKRALSNVTPVKKAKKAKEDQPKLADNSTAVELTDAINRTGKVLVENSSSEVEESEKMDVDNVVASESSKAGGDSGETDSSNHGGFKF